MDIGNSIQFFRKNLGLSQEELGQQLSVSRQTVSQWENGQTMPTIDNLLRLKEIFGISLDALCGCEEPAAPQLLPEKEYSFEPNRENIKELCRFSGRPNLHRFIITTAISIVLTISVIINDEASLPGLWVFLLMICMVGFTIRFFKNRKLIRKPWRTVIGNTYVYQLFGDYFQMLCFRDGEQVVSAKYYYRDIKKFHHTKQFLILQTGDEFHALPKDALSDDSPLNTDLLKNPAKRAPGPNIVIWKTASIILFIASLATIFGALMALSILTEYNKLTFQNTWVFFTFLPVPIASIIFGIVAKIKGYPQKKNIIVGIIMAAVLTLYGCFTFIFSGIYSEEPIGVERVEYYMDIDVPEYDQISTQIMGKDSDPTSENYKWYTSDVYFEKDISLNLMEKIQEDTRFTLGIPSELRGLTSTGIYAGDDQYILFYNVDTGQYNEYPAQSGIYRMIMVSFDSESSCMHISEYNINYIAN